MKKHDKYKRLPESEQDHYKLGFLYYNPADHRVILPKRIGWMGWTFNFANPFTYIILLVMIGLIVVIERYFHI